MSVSLHASDLQGQDADFVVAQFDAQGKVTVMDMIWNPADPNGETKPLLDTSAGIP